jgi:class 3 adenylate cyclase
MSLAFGVLSAMRIVLVNRGALFELGEGSPLDALPWWRLEYCNLWLLVAVFLRYCEAIAERKPVGRNVLATFMIAFATLAWVAPESLNRFALACGQFVTTCVGITCIWTLFQARPSRAIVLSRIGIVVGVFGAVGSMVAQNISGSFSPLLEALGSTEPLFQMAVLAVRAQEARKKSADLARATQHFVPKQFLQELGHIDVTTAKLGDAASRHVTVLFADIRNFTALSERMSPAETFAFLNACLSRIGPHIRTNGGFIDKYIGDAIMALFPRDPSDAVRASIAMQSEVAAANARHPERSALAVGIGIHVGTVMMGTIGEAERFEATVISDAVNLTARLESLTKQLGCSVLISEDVFATLDESLRTFTRRLGTFVVKGKAQPVALYEVFASDSDSLRDAKKATRDRFDAMLTAFAGDRVDEAIAIASELRDACPEDGPANWWFMRLVKESASTGDDAVPSSRGIVRLDEK